MPDLFKYPNIATRLVAMMVPVTSRYEQSIMQVFSLNPSLSCIGNSCKNSRARKQALLFYIAAHI